MLVVERDVVGGLKGETNLCDVPRFYPIGIDFDAGSGSADERALNAYPRNRLTVVQVFR